MKNIKKELVNRGYSIFPLPPASKIPMICWKKYQTTKASPEELKTWFNRTSNNVAIVTGKISNLVVIDVDKKSIVLPENEYPLTRRVETPNGYHLYYQYPKEGKIVNSVSQIASHVDIRGEGGYVVGPGSYVIQPVKDKMRGKLNGVYTEDDTKIAECPEWIKEICEKSFTSKLSKIEKIIDGVRNGERNNSAASMSGYLLWVVPQAHWHIAWKLLLGWNLQNKPPLDEEELKTVFNSIANIRTGQNR